MKTKSIISLIPFLLALASCPSPAVQPGSENASLTVSMNFDTVETARGVYIWIEDGSGNYVDTIQQYGGEDGLYETSNSRYDNDICTLWQAAVSEEDPDVVTGASLVADGISGASILPNGSGSYTSENWDLKDVNGVNVSTGTYTVKVEVTYDSSDQNKSTATGDILIGNSSSTITMTEGIDDSDRISDISATYTPAP